jgi:hypothetical protein
LAGILGTPPVHDDYAAAGQDRHPRMIGQVLKDEQTTRRTAMHFDVGLL